MSNNTISERYLQHTSDCADIVIIGNGIAGLTTAVEARRLAPDTRIAIITDQCHPTINTPALKQFAIGKLTQEQLLAYPAGTERAQRIRVINARVEAIDAQRKFLRLRGGYTFGYGSLLIATGSRPNGLPAHLPGHDFDGVLTLHCLQDYLDLRRRLHGVSSAVVIGGGAHAIETVMGLLYYGVEVHWLIRSETFLPQMLDSTASSLVLENTRNAGAKIAMKTEVLGLVGRMGSTVGVITNYNNMIPCQLVLVCTGTSAVTSLAEHCTIPMMHDDGIFVDEQFRTSVHDIYAAGDVAARKNPQTGVYQRQAQWYAAVLQGRSAAAAMTGYHELTAYSIGVPWHATHLGDLSMLTVGNPLHTFEGMSICTDHSKKRYCRMSIIGDRLVGYLSIGAAQPDSLAIKNIIDERRSIRSIKKDLLKGEFDARKYFSQWRSQETLEMVTSGKIPVVKPRYYVVPLARSIPAAAPCPTHPPAIATVQMIHASAMPGSTVSTIARMETPRLGPVQKPGGKGSVYRAERSGADIAIGEGYVLSSCADQPTIHGWEHDAGPSSGEVAVPSAKEITSILLSLPSRPVSRNLWSYSCESAPLPVICEAKEQTSFPQQPKQNQSEKANFLL